MKLRNKKTGEIVGSLDELCTSYSDRSLAELNEEWEDYKPQEPLIKDEKVRKAVRAFSTAIREKTHILVVKHPSLNRAEFSNGSSYWIKLPLAEETMDALEDRTYYTIEELCGEEE